MKGSLSKLRNFIRQRRGTAAYWLTCLMSLVAVMMATGGC